MQNLNNYNDQFRQAMSMQQVSLQNTTFQKRLIMLEIAYTEQGPQGPQTDATFLPNWVSALPIWA